MGMFDEIRCEYPLPDSEVQEELFQTKSFENLMDHYTITQDGRLIKHEVKWEPVPEEERPYYGTPEWDKHPFLQLAGSIKEVPVGDVEIPYHGDIRFYTSKETKEPGKREWYEYRARFTEGKVQWIKRMEERS
jgi:hypothetical protein